MARNKNIKPLVQRFWESVRKTETCWVVDRSPAHRYPPFKLGDGTGRSIGSHRLSWTLHFGPIPDGMCVCHHCDNNRCVRPDHLFLGTNEENTADKVRKNRQARGVQLRMNKLTPERVVEIRRLWATREHRMEDLGAMFGVSDSCIDFVVNRKSWKHVA